MFKSNKSIVERVAVLEHRITGLETQMAQLAAAMLAQSATIAAAAGKVDTMLGETKAAAMDAVKAMQEEHQKVMAALWGVVGAAGGKVPKPAGPELRVVDGGKGEPDGKPPAA